MATSSERSSSLSSSTAFFSVTLMPLFLWVYFFLWRCGLTGNLHTWKLQLSVKKKNKETFMKTVSWSFPGNFTMCYVLFLCHFSYLNVVKLYWEYGQCLVTAWEKKTYKKPSISVFFVWKILNHILRQLSWHLLCPSGSFSQETMYMLNEPPCLSVDQIALCEPWEAVRPHCLSLIFAISCLIQGILRVGSHGLAHFWIQQLWLVAVWNLWKDRTRKWPRHPGFVLWVACIWFKL